MWFGERVVTPRTIMIKDDAGKRLQLVNAEGDNCGANRSKRTSRKGRDDNGDDGDDSDENSNENGDSSTQKKPRAVWSIELHRKFVAAVNQLGIDKAVPKKILDLMNVENITRDNVGLAAGFIPSLRFTSHFFIIMFLSYISRLIKIPVLYYYSYYKL